MPRRIIAATLLFTFTQASCYAWTPVQGIPSPLPEKVRVELWSGEWLELTDLYIERDTLIGQTDRGTYTRVPGAAPGTRLARVPVSEIESLETEKLSYGRTGLLVVGVAVVALGVAAAIAMSDGVVDWGISFRSDRPARGALSSGRSF